MRRNAEFKNLRTDLVESAAVETIHARKVGAACGKREHKAPGRDPNSCAPRIFSQKCISRVDDPFLVAILLTPPETGLPTAKAERSCVLAHCGTANWNSILSRLFNGNVSSRKTGLSFFVVKHVQKLLVL